MRTLNIIFLLAVLFMCACQTEEDRRYSEFLDQLKAGEAYIGFFASEEKYITDKTDQYLAERRKCFLGISASKEEPFDFIEPFVTFLQKEALLKEEHTEEWQKVLTILSFELYANMPIFDFKADNIIAHRDLVYARYPNKELALDLFLPEQPLDRPVPAVVCIHGGGWMVNRRIWFEPFAQYLATKGIAAVTIDYRKLPAVSVMECVYDSKAAVRWLRTNADKYDIDPNRIGALGASAGAHLAAVLATTSQRQELEGQGGNQGISSAVQAAVGIATPAFAPGTDSLAASKFGLDLEKLQQISPYRNITADAAPLYLIHGTADETVLPNNAQQLYDKYIQVGAHAELKWIADAGHGFYEGNDKGIKLATDFFLKQFRENK